MLARKAGDPGSCIVFGKRTVGEYTLRQIDIWRAYRLIQIRRKGELGV